MRVYGFAFTATFTLVIKYVLCPRWAESSSMKASTQLTCDAPPDMTMNAMFFGSLKPSFTSNSVVVSAAAAIDAKSQEPTTSVLVVTFMWNLFFFSVESRERRDEWNSVDLCLINKEWWSRMKTRSSKSILCICLSSQPLRLFVQSITLIPTWCVHVYYSTFSTGKLTRGILLPLLYYPRG